MKKLLNILEIAIVSVISVFVAELILMNCICGRDMDGECGCLSKCMHDDIWDEFEF